MPSKADCQIPKDLEVNQCKVLTLGVSLCAGLCSEFTSLWGKDHFINCLNFAWEKKTCVCVSAERVKGEWNKEIN